MLIVPAVPLFSPAPDPVAFSSHSRVVLIVSSDASLRERLRNSLSSLRWRVLEAESGATASWEASQVSQLDALMVDSWLPDLQVQEFISDFQRQYPKVDLITTDGIIPEGVSRSPNRRELLYALCRSQEGNRGIWNEAFQEVDKLALMSPSFASSHQAALSKIDDGSTEFPPREQSTESLQNSTSERCPEVGFDWAKTTVAIAIDKRFANAILKTDETPVESSSELPSQGPVGRRDSGVPLLDTSSLQGTRRAVERIPELIGSSPSMLEVSRRIRLVATRTTPVLIEGPTGSGKEVVAEALHRLSSRARKPFVAINCAAIPEALLEAELFGHTRGAFTGAVQGRIGRIESANGGTLFLDEIGEMPLALQSKLLRFFESGEIQRIGDNETIRVDVRLISATHQPLAQNAQKGSFRADLYYRLAVFLIHTPALSEHMSDLALLVAHFMERMGRNAPIKRVDSSAMRRLASHDWPGNVRELEHVLERAVILAGDIAIISGSEIDFGLSPMN